MIINMVGGSGGGFGSFAATLNVTTSAGATVSATSTSSGKTFSGTAGINGVCSLAIKAPGTYAITATLDGAIATGSIVVADNGYTYNLTVLFWNGELYDAGNEFPELTGGWITHTMDTGGSSVTKQASSILIDKVQWYGNIRTANMVDISDASAIRATFTNLDKTYNRLMGVTKNANEYFNSRLNVSSQNGSWTSGNCTQLENNQVDAQMTLDVSTLTGSYYIVIAAGGDHENRYSAELTKVEMLP